ncbi:esterase-like activity of phytase family protein [Tranquillimonas rosea]|uniref:esterase-like activity of phytase family protein n=1 Tax=Tranquillimonas rosea TaxID=641238 RepID=UPI003BA87A38
MSIRTILLGSAAVMALSLPATAQNFNRIASFPTVGNMADGAETSRPTSAEIIDATEDGMTLVYTDSPLGVLGMVDISDPANPAPLGNIDMQGEPTSVKVIGSTAYVGVNTSKSFTDPSGELRVISIPEGEELASCDLGGQPDAVATAPDGSFISVAIENERDEDLDDGEIPQMPAGNLVMIDVTDNGLDCESLRTVDLTGLADVAPSDPEPEYVDINTEGETVVTLQENNHLVVVSREGEVLADFSAGAVDLEGIDATEDGKLAFDESQEGRKREPDAVAWIDETHFAIANEGDYEGGSRGWTIFSQEGEVVYESGTSFEEAIIRIGHYPEGRSDAKGVEPESVTFGKYDGTPLVFVGSERASVVGVYDVTDPASPQLTQLLPSGIGPEGYVTIPSRGLLVSANEEDFVEDGGARAHVMLFEYQQGGAVYPHLTSAGMDELTGWGAISGMVADEDGTIYAVNDSYYSAQPTIFAIDPSHSPARITRAIRVTRDGEPAQHMDMEGIALDGAGGFWVANEGDAEDGIPHALYHVGADGSIQDEVPFPSGLSDVARRHAAEGIARVGDTLWIAIQRAWDDDPENMSKLISYNTESGAWGAVHYEKAAAETGWIGLSEIAYHDGAFFVVERDNQIGEAARVKKIYRIDEEDMQPAPLGEQLKVVEKEEVRDLIPDLTATGGFVLDKVEGLAIQPDGTAWVSTDNDGVDDHSGETMFFSIDRL